MELPGRLRRRPVPNTIVWFGDSITFNGGRSDYSPTIYNGNGFWGWAQFLLGHALITLANLGVTGQQTAQMVARINDVLNYRPGWVHILAGTNDVNHDIPYGQIVQNLDYMLGVMEGQGVRAVLGTIPPNNSLTATQRLVLNQVNAWIRTQGKARGNVIVVDYYAALVGPSSGQFAGSGFLLNSNDGTHPNALGAYNMGVALSNALKAAGMVGGYDLFADDADTTNCLLYGNFVTGGTGSAPTGWNGSTPTNTGTVTYSRTARTDLPNRSWQTLTLAPSSGGAATAMTFTDANTRTGTFAVGDSVVGMLECSISSLDQAPASYYQAGVSMGIRALNVRCSGHRICRRSSVCFRLHVIPESDAE